MEQNTKRIGAASQAAIRKPAPTPHRNSKQKPRIEEASSPLPDDAALVRQAETLLSQYKQGKQALEKRIIDNELWFRQRHWDVSGRSRNPGDPEPVSGWLFNSLANKHADAMDSLPGLTVLPREEGDKHDAAVLSDVLPVVLEQNDYEQVYSDMWWYKLRSGTGVTGVFWDPAKQGGLGDITIRSLDLLNLFWEPGISDLQDSRNLFYISLHDGDLLKAQYPQLAEASASPASPVAMAEYVRDESIDRSGKMLMVDWYYKRWQNGRMVLHLCKICSGCVLFCSEREPAFQNGYYHHGQYPFVLDTLFPIPDSPVGFGFIDVCKSPQVYIDRLDQALLKNTIIGARPRWFIKGDGMINEEEYADVSNDFVHFAGSGNPQESILQVQVPQLNPYAIAMRQAKIDELKEVSGNRDFSQGATAGGVTAFSAIQMLRESGSKLSRDMIASAYRAFAQVGYLCIDLMRQFYDAPRTFRISGAQGETAFATFSGRQIASKLTSDGFMTSSRTPVFDIRVIARHNDPYSSILQNERAQVLYQMGFFAPQMAEQALLALDMMDFEGIDRVRARISQSVGLRQHNQQLEQLSMAMAEELDRLSGQSKYAPMLRQILLQAPALEGR